MLNPDLARQYRYWLRATAASACTYVDSRFIVAGQPRPGQPGSCNPNRLMSKGTRFQVMRIPYRITLDRYVAVRRAMALAAYHARIRPIDGVPKGAIDAMDRAIIDGEIANVPPEYRALLDAIAQAEASA